MKWAASVFLFFPIPFCGAQFHSGFAVDLDESHFSGEVEDQNFSKYYNYEYVPVDTDAYDYFSESNLNRIARDETLLLKGHTSLLSIAPLFSKNQDQNLDSIDPECQLTVIFDDGGDKYWLNEGIDELQVLCDVISDYQSLKLTIIRTSWSHMDDGYRVHIQNIYFGMPFQVLNYRFYGEL